MENTNTFTVELKPGQNKSVILRPEIEGNYTSMQMRFQYELQDI